MKYVSFMEISLGATLKKKKTTHHYHQKTSAGRLPRKKHDAVKNSQNNASF